ncbi:MAG: nitroreductase family deazaflavin-dependent oxidoreductase, partial [bacterium]
PWFLLAPPAGFGVIESIGRRTRKPRRKCVRAIRRGDRVYLVSIPGAEAAWLKNLRAYPRVRLRLRGGWFTGRARELVEDAELREAFDAYCGTVNSFDRREYVMHRRGRPTRKRIRELHRTWFEVGTPVVVEIGP